MSQTRREARRCHDSRRADRGPRPRAGGRCEAEARRFYGWLLGLPELPKPDSLAARGGAWFACGAQQLHVGVTEEFEAARKAHPALRLTDVGELERLAERLAYSGVDVHWDDELPGARRFYVEDPWGNRLELLALAAR